MKPKTRCSYNQTVTRTIILLLMLMVVVSESWAQISASPTRVTFQSRVFITNPSANYTNTDRDRIGAALHGGGALSIGNKQRINGQQMSFDITTTSATDLIADITINSIDTGIDIFYIAPIKKVSSIYSYHTPGFAKITEIFTDWNFDGDNFWRSNQWRNNDVNTWPNSHNNLLAFTFNGITYSTGANDAALNLKLGAGNFVPKRFKAYSTPGVQGNVNSNHYLIVGDALNNVLDPSPEPVAIPSPSEIENFTIFNSIIDGLNGLDLGTGITNFNNAVTVKFFSGNGNVGALGDDVPDVIVTQIADANDNSSDIYYYADVHGNVVGKPVALNIRFDGNNSNTYDYLGKWRMDLFKYPNGVSFQAALPATYATNQSATWKSIKMVGLKLDDFNLTPSDIPQINNINMAAGGNADIAFLAYNKDAFDIKSPIATRYPVSQFVCKFPNTTSIKFNAIADIEGRLPSDPIGPGQALEFQWSKYNTTLGTFQPMGIASPDADLDFVGGITTSDLGLYNLTVRNAFGTIILPVNLVEGGTPYIWNGTQFDLPNVYTAAGINPNPSDRNLIFAEDYNLSVDIEGCNCRVQAGTNVTIPAGITMKLFSELTVEEAVPFDPVLGSSAIPAGIFLLEDTASLVQTKPVNVNANLGTILMKREARNLNPLDYVYWSSPVSNFNINAIATTPAYLWNPTIVNALGSSGNWVSAANTIMQAGKGYIVRAASANIPAFINTFEGNPNNGTINITIQKSSGGTAPIDENKHWNLIGNPYPSAISARKFLIANAQTSPKIEGNVRIWKHDAAISNLVSSPYYNNYSYNYGDQYLTFNLTGSNPAVFNGNIAAGQAFFVQALESNAANETITFRNDLRFDSSENAYDNTDFFRNSEEITESITTDEQRIWLSLKNEDDISKTALVGYIAGATDGEDVLYDAQLEGYEFNLYSIIDQKQFGIQGRSLPFNSEDVVTLGIALPSNGIYKLGIDTLDGSQFIDDSQPFYVQDMYLNTIHDIRLAPYVFTANAGLYSDRFLLKYVNNQETLSTNDLVSFDTFISINNNRLLVRAPSTIKSIAIYDITGKKIINYVAGTSAAQFGAEFHYSKGIYIALVTLEDGSVVKRKLVN